MTLEKKICRFFVFLAIIQCYSSISMDVQTLTNQILIKQIRTTEDIPTFLFLYTEDGLKSPSNRLRLKCIQSLMEILTPAHQHENLSPILEVLLQYLQDNTFRVIHGDILIQSIEYLRRILGLELFNTYLKTFSPSSRRAYQSYVEQNDHQPQIPIVDTDLEDEEATPRASTQALSMKEKISSLSNGTNHTDESNQLHSSRKPSHPSPESTEFYSIIELMRSKWLSANEANRLNYLERFKQAAEKYLQFIRLQHLAGNDTQFHQVLYTFLTTMLDLLSYITSSNLELTIKIKLVLCTCLGWLIKHAQVNYCKRNYKTICTVFKNILINGQSNNRQLAVSVIFFSEKRNRKLYARSRERQAGRVSRRKRNHWIDRLRLE